MAAESHARQGHPASRSAAPVVVGREREQTLLREALAAAMAGHGRLVLLGGEAGIGKTTLARDLAEAAEGQGAAVAIGRGLESGGLPVYGPWREILADLRDDGAEADSLPPPFGEGPPVQSAHQLMLRVATHIHAASARRPLVLLLDDLHWADRDTLELLDDVTRSVERERILALATYRPEALDRTHSFFDVLPRLYRNRPVTTLQLSTLGVNDAARVVEAVHGACTCSPALAAYLHGRSDGHPLLLTELLRDLLDRGLLPQDDEGLLLPPTHTVQVPALLQHLIAHRIARLGADEETFLTVAAVVGKEWDLRVVEAVLGWQEEPLLCALEGTLRADIIAAGDGERYRFRHDLIHQVLYEGQIARRRKHLHGRVAAVLAEAEPGAHEDREAALAFHFAEAGEWDRAVHHGIAAGDVSRDRFAGHSALWSYQQALNALERASPEAADEARVGLSERLGQAHLVLGQPDAAESAFALMLQHALEQGNRQGEALALAWLSYVQRRQYKMVESRINGEAGLTVAEEVGEPRMLGVAHWNLGHLHEIGGDLRRSSHHARQAEQIARETDETEILGLSLQTRAMLAVWHGQYAEAVQHANEALDLARLGRDGLALISAYWRLGLALGEQGHYAAARRVLAGGIAEAESLGERYFLAKLLNTMGWLHGELGDPGTASDWNERALEMVRLSSDRVTEAERYTLLNLADDDLARGRAAAAAERLRTLEPLLDQDQYARFRYVNRYQLLRGEVALAQGDPERALLAAEEAPRLATEKNMPKNLVRGHLLAGRALLAQERPREAREALTEGVALADQIAHGSLRWQGRLWLGQTLMTLRLDATLVLGEAIEQVESIDRGIEDQHMQEAFRDSAMVRELRRALAEAELAPPEPERPAGLTARELEVLLLLAQHQTDKEIAAALFLSPRTISTHVANILNKLGVDNRREAAVMAGRLGLQ